MMTKMTDPIPVSVVFDAGAMPLPDGRIRLRSNPRGMALGSLLLAGVLGVGVLPAQAADIKLYETGPAEDSSFVRFVAASADPVDLTAAGSQAKIVLTPASPATGFFPIRANSDIKGTFNAKGARSDVSLKVKPGEFASVVVQGDSKGLTQTIVREEPDDFNALKVSVGLFNTDKRCANAALQVAGRTTLLVDAVAPGTVKRRSVNPVNIGVRLMCDGKPAGEPLPLGQLQAGERYSVFAVPDGQGTRIIFANDAVAR